MKGGERRRRRRDHELDRTVRHTEEGRNKPLVQPPWTLFFQDRLEGVCVRVWRVNHQKKEKEEKKTRSKRKGLTEDATIVGVDAKGLELHSGLDDKDGVAEELRDDARKRGTSEVIEGSEGRPV